MENRLNIVQGRSWKNSLDMDSKIQIYPFIGNLHSSNQTLISNPPEGYNFIGRDETKKKAVMNMAKSSKILRAFYHQFVRLAKTTALLDYLNSSDRMPEAALIYSINTIYKGDSPWVLEILDNTPDGLTGYNHELFLKSLKRIEMELAKDNCRKIICSNKSSFRLMKKFFSEEVTKKLILIERPYFIGQPETGRKHKNLTLLFIGSLINPEDFYAKGGLETLIVFERISQKYPCKLVLKCKIPEELKERVANNKNITLIEDKISANRISNLYLSSDIFLMPAHAVMGAIMEAMAYGLPIVCLDTFAIEDYVKNNFSGFVVKKSAKIKEYMEESYPTNLRADGFIEKIKNLDEKVIERLCSAVESLIKNPRLRKRIGKNARKIMKKYYSIDNRNRLLKKVFDEILKNEPERLIYSLLKSDGVEYPRELLHES